MFIIEQREDCTGMSLSSGGSHMFIEQREDCAGMS